MCYSLYLSEKYRGLNKMVFVTYCCYKKPAWIWCLKTTEIYHLTVLEVRVQNGFYWAAIRCWQSLFLLEAPGENHFLAISSFSGLPARLGFHPYILLTPASILHPLDPHMPAFLLQGPGLLE